MRLVLLPPGPCNPRNSEGDLIRLRDGRILLVYTHFTGGNDDHASAHLAGRYSRDGGMTWDDHDTMVLPNEGHMNVMSVSLLRLKDGRVAMFYLVKNSETDCRPSMRISSDECKTWGERIPIIDKPGYYVLNNDRVVQLKSGRLVVPVAMHRSPDSAKWFNILMCYLSDDNGKTWRRSKEQVQGKTPDGTGFTTQEPGLLPLADGRLLMHCRTDRGYHYFTYSRDEGDSWTPLEPSTLRGPCTAAAIERIPTTGDLLCLWNEGPKDKLLGLSKYTIGLSRDEGKTWKKVYVLEDRKKPYNRYCCYCAILFVDDHVLLAHCNGHWGSTTTVHEALQITRFPVSRLYERAKQMAVASVAPMRGDAYPEGTKRITYTSAVDGAEDWALFLPGDPAKNTVVYLHGSFSRADQIFTRKDVRDFWLTRIRRGAHSLLSVNLRGTSYMSPAATTDLTELLDYCRARFGCRRFVLLGGSGGASSAMAYAVLHPERIHGVVAMGMCDIFARLDFARRSGNPVLQKLATTVFAAYGGTLEEKPGLYRARSVLAHADRLTMPVVLTMGGADPLIPVTETRKIAAAMKGKSNFVYHEIPAGNHDSALWVDIDLETLQIRKRNYEAKILAFEAADKIKPPPQNAIVFTGASNIVGWKTLAEDFPGLAVVNRGFGGSHIADCVFYADRIVIPYKPRVVVLRTGGNDINAGKTPKQVAADFKAFAEKIHAKLPHTRIAFWSMTPSVTRLGNWDREKKGNELIKAYIAAGKNMVYIDSAEATLDPDGKPRADLFTDGLHFHREAYRMFAKIIRPYLE